MRFVFILIISTIVNGQALGQEVTKGWLGVKLIDVIEDDDATALGRKSARGAKVVEVVRAGPADNAGIRADDVLLSIDGIDIEDAASLTAVIMNRQAHHKITLLTVRNGKQIKVEVVLGDRPHQIVQAEKKYLPQPQRLQIDTGGHQALIRDIIFTPDGRHLISAGDDKIIRVWDLETRVTVRTIRGENGPGIYGTIYAMALSPDGKFLAVGGIFQDSDTYVRFAIRIYDFASGALKTLLKSHYGAVHALAFSLDGKWLISGSDDGSAVLWDMQGGKALHRLQGHRASVMAVSFMPDGESAITGSKDSDLRLWNVQNGRQIGETVTGHVKEIGALAIMPDGTVVSGDHQGEILLWHPVPRSEKGVSGLRFGAKLAGVSGSVTSLSLSPDGKRLLVGIGNRGGATDYRICRVYEVSSGREVFTYREHDNFVTATNISSDGRWAATGGGNDNEIHIWDLLTGTRRLGIDGLPLSLKGTGRPVRAVGISFDGRRVGWGNTGEAVQPNARSPLQYSINLPSKIETIVAPYAVEEQTEKDFQREVTQIPGRSLALNRLNDIEIRDETSTSVVGEDRIKLAYSFAPDGETVIIGGQGGFISLYDLKGKKIENGELDGHEGAVWALAASVDGRYLVSGGSDQTVRLWNLKTHELIVTFFGGTDGRWVIWTPQGYYAGSPGADNIVGWQINKGSDKAADYVKAEQLRKYLYRPDIVDQAITLGSAEAAVQRAPDLGPRLEELLAIERPRLTIDAPVKAVGGVASVTLSLDATVDRINDISINVNGTNIPFDKQTILAATGKGAQTVQIPLFQGKNLIRVSAKNIGGETSKTLETIHDGEGALDQRGTLYVLAIGVSAYKGLGSVCGDDQKLPCDLPYARNNAKEFAEFAEARLQPGHRTAPVVRVMVNDAGGDLEPTAANIEKQLALFKQAKANDTVVLYISGHGGTEEMTNNYSFYASDARFVVNSPKFAPGTIVPWSKIDEALNDAYGRKLSFIDTCFSSAAYYKGFAGRTFYASEVAYLSAGPNQKGIWHQKYLGSLFARATVDGLNREAKEPLTTSSLASFIRRRLQEMLGDLEKNNDIPAGTHQDAQFILGRDAKDFALDQRQAPIPRPTVPPVALAVPLPPVRLVQPEPQGVQRLVGRDCSGINAEINGQRRCLKRGDTFRDCTECPDMVVIPPGEFLMGSPESEKGRNVNEGPQHKVTIPAAFAVGRSHVTVMEFAAFVRTKDYKPDAGCFTWTGSDWQQNPDATWKYPGIAGDGDDPVACISMKDAEAYIAWINSKKPGGRYRLLSEAEAEYIARGVSVSTPQPRFFFGDEDRDFCDHANGGDEAARAMFPALPIAPCLDGYAYSTHAAAFKPNAFRVYDVLGNLFTWTADCWNSSYLHKPAKLKSTGGAWTDHRCTDMVGRGGSWLTPPQIARSALRAKFSRSTRIDTIGFRVARTLAR